MADSSMLEICDAAELPLTRRYWFALILLTLITVFEYFDLTVVGYLGATIARLGHLSYGQLSTILLAAGLGGVIGALVWGELSDRCGRRLAILLGTSLCGLSSLCVLMVPNGAWLALASLRFLIGVGIGGAAAPVMALAVEYTPDRHGRLLSSLPVIGATGGSLVATTLVASLIALVGWRGIMALGVLPMLLGVVLMASIPESARWLASKGRVVQARAALERMHGIAAARTQFRSVPDATGSSFSEVFRDRRRATLTVVLWAGALTANSGVYLWGPTLLGVALGDSVAHIARVFMMVSICGMLGKVGFSLLPGLIGRRRANEVGCIGSAAALASAALCHNLTVVGIPALLLLIVAGALFYDGMVANLAPYTIEIYPTQLAARGYGLGQAANSLAKIAAPATLAIIAGAGSYVSPKSTASAVGPSFLFLAACAGMAALGSLFLHADAPANGGAPASRVSSG